MAFRVRIDSFEGPFDLLLYLVSRQKVSIGSISITQITDQYLAEVARMQSLDLDVASDFLLVASTLLEIKAESLLPQEHDPADTELDELTPSEAREVLVERLVTYKQYKNAARALAARLETESRMHVRPFGPDACFLGLMPDYLEKVALDDLARLAALALGRSETFLLESEHIAAKPIPVETYVQSIGERVRNTGVVRFSELVSGTDKAALIVVTFLAVLELYKRGMVRICQEQEFGDIDITYVEGGAQDISAAGEQDAREGSVVTAKVENAAAAGERVAATGAPAEEAKEEARCFKG